MSDHFANTHKERFGDGKFEGVKSNKEVLRNTCLKYIELKSAKSSHMAWSNQNRRNIIPAQILYLSVFLPTIKEKIDQF